MAENRASKQKTSVRYYQIGGFTIQVESDIPIRDNTFSPNFRPFRVDTPGEDNIVIRHHFSIPDTSDWDWGRELYHKAPWSIYRSGDSWIYKHLPASSEYSVQRIAILNDDHTAADIYNSSDHLFRRGRNNSLTLFSTDQVMLARTLAHKSGFYIHSSGVIFNGNGLAFVGHSEAGKSTMAMMLRDEAQILCDDRNIIRKTQHGYRIYGTWSHGDLPIVSPNSAPLKALMFLEQSEENRLLPIDDAKEIIMRRLMPRVIRPLVDSDWWNRILDLLEEMAHQIPCYVVRFDKDGRIVDVLRDFCRN